MDENITFKVNYYRDSGFDEESIRTATEDMKNGVDIEIVECYMNANIPKEQRLELANLFRQGMPLELGTRLAGLGKSQLDEVLIHAKERIPFEAIRSIIMQYTSAHQIKKAFEVYIEKAKERAKEFSIEDDSTKVDSNKSVESKTTEEAEKMTGNEMVKEETVTAETDAQATSTQRITSESLGTTSVVEQPASPQKTHAPTPAPTPAPDGKELIKEIQKVFSDSTKTLVDKINDHNAGIYADMITKFDDGIQAIVDEIRKDMRQNYQLQTPKIPDTTVVDKQENAPAPIVTPAQTPTPQVAPAPAVSPVPTPIAPSEPAAFDSQAALSSSSPFSPELVAETPAPAPVSQRVAEVKRARKVRPDYLEDAISYTRMILMPDGSLRPIEVEQANPKKPRGLIGWASRVFGKDAPQESLLRQLINGKLSAPQLKQIQRAVKAAFSPLEVKDLIESDLEPEEMGNIIDVILADRGQILEVV